MSDPDRDAEPELQTNPRYDSWPVERYDAYADWPVERATPRDEGGTLEEVAEEYQERDDEDAEWLGFVGDGAEVAGPYVYTPGGSAIYEGDIDEDDERIVLRDESRREVESEESLGEHIEEIGDEHGWRWLSSFAREYLEDDEDASAESVDALELRDSEFDRRNLTGSASYDLGFFGSHTLVDASGRVYVIERRFNVNAAETNRTAVEVEESCLAAEEAAEKRRAGDAELVEKRQHGFDIEADTDAGDWEAEVEAYLKKWHAAHVGWPSDE